MDALIRSVDSELSAARHAPALADKWRHLERAHVLSQPSAWHHTRVHVHMLGLAWTSKDGAEIVGQLVRIILAAPGSLVGRYPVGNSGRAAVPLTENQPIAEDLQIELRRAGKRTE